MRSCRLSFRVHAPEILADLRKGKAEVIERMRKRTEGAGGAAPSLDSDQKQRFRQARAKRF